jgi:F5/8 type C domain-containing protein
MNRSHLARLLSTLSALTLFAGCIEPGEDAPDELGTTTSALAFDSQGTIHMGWNAWGYTINSTVGGPCRSGTVRDHAEIYADYGAPAVFLGWATTLPTDCTARFQTSVSNGHWDDFHWSVFSNKINLAASRTASQSSSPFGGDPMRAVDGNTDGNWYDSSVSHTGFDAQAWWQVDLGTTRALGEVVMFNRTDCCTDRLSNFDILLSNDGVTWELAASYPGAAPARTSLTVTGSARYVRVSLRGTNYLSLAEVQVFAP